MSKEEIDDLALSKYPIREYWTSHRLYDENYQDRIVFNLGIQEAVEHLMK